MEINILKETCICLHKHEWPMRRMKKMNKMKQNDNHEIVEYKNPRYRYTLKHEQLNHHTFEIEEKMFFLFFAFFSFFFFGFDLVCQL